MGKQQTNCLAPGPNGRTGRRCEGTDIKSHLEPKMRLNYPADCPRQYITFQRRRARGHICFRLGSTTLLSG